MAVKVAINGFGRIGRLALRIILKRPEIEVVAINDLVPPENLAYLFAYDSTHGRYQGHVSATDDALMIDGKKIKICSERDPIHLPWKDLGVSLVMESTGLFTKLADAEKHLAAGAERVLISAPAKGGGVPTYCMGVNHDVYQPEERIVSNASCTTNCLAPLTKVILEEFGIEEGLMTTVHAVTATQPTVDAPSKKDFRGGRGAFQNIIPASTGAAKAVGLCLPAVAGKLTGMAFRVPVADVSVVDLTVRTERSTSYDQICAAMKRWAEGPMKGILRYCDEQVVSTDFIGDPHSSIFDSGAGIALNDRFFKLVAWYDNESGYAHRLVDFALHMIQRAPAYK